MKKLVICAFLGGAIGAGVAKLQGGSGDQESSSSMVPAVASGAAVGAFFGLLLNRRARRAAKAAAAVPVALAYAKKVGDAALDVLEQAAEAATPFIEDIQERIAA